MATIKLKKPTAATGSARVRTRAGGTLRTRIRETSASNDAPIASAPERRTSDTPIARSSKPRTPDASSAPAAKRRTSAPTTTPRPKRREPPAPTPAQSAHPEGSLRLSKRMSELGLTSRREADEWIERGWVLVDGVRITELGSRVLPHQRIEIDQRAHKEQAQRVTILLNKPVGYVSGQPEPGYEPAVKLITPDNRWAEDSVRLDFKREHLRSLAPAGRLDIDSVGLLVFTQDGRLAKQLIGENSAVEKEYLVRVRYTRGERLPEEGLALLNHGLALDGVALKPAKVSWQNEDQLRFVLREGRKRQIRHMCEAVGLEVLGLKRIRIGSVSLGKLPPGQWRYLAAHERF